MLRAIQNELGACHVCNSLDCPHPPVPSPTIGSYALRKSRQTFCHITFLTVTQSPRIWVHPDIANTSFCSLVDRSFPCKRESRYMASVWMPTDVGMTQAFAKVGCALVFERRNQGFSEICVMHSPQLGEEGVKVDIHPMSLSGWSSLLGYEG